MVGHTRSRITFDRWVPFTITAIATNNWYASEIIMTIIKRIFQNLVALVKKIPIDREYTYSGSVGKRSNLDGTPMGGRVADINHRPYGITD